MCNWADTYELKMEGATSFMNEIDGSYTTQKKSVYRYSFTSSLCMCLCGLSTSVCEKLKCIQHTYTAKPYKWSRSKNEWNVWVAKKNVWKSNINSSPVDYTLQCLVFVVSVFKAFNCWIRTTFVNYEHCGEKKKLKKSCVGKTRKKLK